MLLRMLHYYLPSVSADIADLTAVIDAIRAGKLPEDIANGIRQWIADNFNDIVGLMIKTVWFGLTDSGYFVAYIPDSWSEVMFKTTGYDYTTELQPDYGHLVLQANYYTHSL